MRLLGRPRSLFELAAKQDVLADIVLVRRLIDVLQDRRPIGNRLLGPPGLEVVAMKTLPLDDQPKAIDYALHFADVGVGHLVHTQGYEDADEYQRNVDVLEEKIRPALT